MPIVVGTTMRPIVRAYMPAMIGVVVELIVRPIMMPGMPVPVRSVVVTVVISAIFIIIVSLGVSANTDQHCKGSRGGDRNL